MSKLEGRWEGLQREREELRRTRQQWEATRAEVVSEEVPPEVFERIDGVLENLSDAEGRVRTRSRAIAIVIDRVSSEREVARETLAIEANE